MPTVPTIMVTGLTISSTDSVWRAGLMEPSTKETTLTAKRKEKESLLLLTEAITKENSNKTRFVDLENITGPMENNTRENGAIIKCTEKEP
jgi:hypothetical protein